jgi:hypothetical protein
MPKGKESRSKSRERRKLNETETVKCDWLRVEAKTNVVKVVVRKGQMRMLKSFCKLYHCIIVSAQKSCYDTEIEEGCLRCNLY